MHIDAFSSLGVSFNSEKEGENIIFANGHIKGGSVVLKYPSVGATENIMIGASSCTEKTVIINAACDPEIVDLQNYLQKCGVNITGAGTSVITIYGTSEMNKVVVHDVIPDRIEACTYLTAACLIGDGVLLKNCGIDNLSLFLNILNKCGAEFSFCGDSINVVKSVSADFPGLPMFIKTGPHPMPATDMQPFFTVIAAVTGCFCAIEETVFPDRIKHVGELCRMGAKLAVSGRFILCSGAAGLRGAELASSDLRCGAALLVAALCAEGVSVVNDSFDYIMRGYCEPEKKLSALGAHIVKLQR